MTIQNKYDSVAISAGADLSAGQYKVINIGGTLALSGATSFGILQNKPAASGRAATVGYTGIMKARAGAAIAVGAGLDVTSNAAGGGWVITVTSGSAAVGKALYAANSGDTFTGLFNFAGGYQP